MRTHGTLSRWNSDRGFGYITPAQLGDDLFVHISAFPRSADAPRIGELMSFEIEPGKDGRQQAVRVMRAGARAPERSPRRQHAAARSTSAHGPVGLGKVMLLLLVAGAGDYAYLNRDTLMPDPALPQTSSASAAPARTPSGSTPLPERATAQSAPAVPAPASASRTSATPAPIPRYSCGGRRHCSQMTSCDDATYVLQNCPNTAMDGDHDGVPCEQQWCR